MQEKMEFCGRKILVIGAGMSGIAAAKIARNLGAEVVLSDAKAEKDLKDDFAPLRAVGVTLVFGPQEESLLEDVDRIYVSPVVPLRIPLLQAAISRGIPVRSEVELAYGLAEAPIFAVTGTNGKTTTTALLGELLKTAFPEVGIGGNIGIPLAEVALQIGAEGAIAAEISSYQMEASEAFRPHISAVLNITPDHIVRHGTMEVYQAMKEKIFARQSAEDFTVLNYDDEKTRAMAERTAAKVCYFSRKEELAAGAFLQNGMLVLRWAEREYALCTVKELGIQGAHNVENALAASAMAFLAGADPAKMRDVLVEFAGVEHRIEFVLEKNKIPYYNDSKATNTDSAIKALETFEGHILLIAGGDDKLTDLTAFMDLVKERVDALILIGDAAERFQAAAEKAGFPKERIYRAGYSMEKAVATAHELAQAGQVVLLSPACASFDMYTGFEERGRDFKRIVRELKE